LRRAGESCPDHVAERRRPAGLPAFSANSRFLREFRIWAETA
jgi:hypothetical protein